MTSAGMPHHKIQGLYIPQVHSSELHQGQAHLLLLAESGTTTFAFALAGLPS